MRRTSSGGREVLLEFHRVGDYVRVSAIDPITNTEVTVVGSPQVTQEDLTRLAVRKLNYVMERDRAAQEKAADDDSDGGILA